MKNKNKLKLEDLKVESFVTEVDKKNKQTIAGGAVSNPQGFCSHNGCKLECKTGSDIVIYQSGGPDCEIPTFWNGNTANPCPAHGICANSNNPTCNVGYYPC